VTNATALLDGAAAGSVATVVMSAVMLAGDRAGLMGEQPPKAIVRSALQEAGVDRPSDTAALLAPVAHLGFGAGAGVVFSGLRRLIPGAPGPLLGVLYALGVWVVSYKGWVPALGMLPPPEEDRPGRPAVMVAAHVVYGLVLGSLVRPSKGPEALTD